MKILQGTMAGLGVAAVGLVKGIAALGVAAIAAVAGISTLVFKASDAAAELVDLSARRGYRPHAFRNYLSSATRWAPASTRLPARKPG